MKKIIGLLFAVVLAGCSAQPATNMNAPVVNTSQAPKPTSTNNLPTQPKPTRDQGTTSLQQTVNVGGLKITPQEVIEDSRCPVDVVCIQAGTVRVRTLVGESTQTFTLTTPLTIDGYTITLTTVTPATHSQHPIVPTDYRLTFSVSK